MANPLYQDPYLEEDLTKYWTPLNNKLSLLANHAAFIKMLHWNILTFVMSWFQF